VKLQIVVRHGSCDAQSVKLQINVRHGSLDAQSVEVTNHCSPWDICDDGQNHIPIIYSVVHIRRHSKMAP